MKGNTENGMGEGEGGNIREYREWKGGGEGSIKNGKREGKGGNEREYRE